MSDKPSVVLIGNGSSVLNQRLGKVIDTFDLVVRFNHYNLNGFEEWVGTKTDFWFTTAIKNIHIPSSEDLEFSRTYWHSWHWRPEDDIKYPTFLELYPKTIKTTRNLISEMQEITGQTEYGTYSTGAIAVHILVKEFGLVHLYGFDWWDGLKQNHYGDSLPQGPLHQPDKEYEFLKVLADANKVRDLNPRSSLTERK